MHVAQRTDEVDAREIIRSIGQDGSTDAKFQVFEIFWQISNIFNFLNLFQILFFSNS